MALPVYAFSGKSRRRLRSSSRGGKKKGVSQLSIVSILSTGHGIPTPITPSLCLQAALLNQPKIDEDLRRVISETLYRTGSSTY
jgi:hypothetical protein